MSGLAITVEDVDGDEDHAELDAGQIDVDQLDAIAEVDAEAVAFGEAAGAERMCDAIAAALDVAKGEFGALPFERDVVAARDEREVEEMEQVHAARSYGSSADDADWTQMCTFICPMATRKRPIGAEIIAEGTSFRVWAPVHREVSVVIDG